MFITFYMMMTIPYKDDDDDDLLEFLCLLVFIKVIGQNY